MDLKIYIYIFFRNKLTVLPGLVGMHPTISEPNISLDTAPNLSHKQAGCRLRVAGESMLQEMFLPELNLV